MPGSIRFTLSILLTWSRVPANALVMRDSGNYLAVGGIMLSMIEKVERFIVYLLVILLLISIILGTAELARITVQQILSAPQFLVDVNKLFDSFALFIVIVVGLELLKSIKSYLILGSINPVFVVEVAIIALGNKLITLDLKEVQAPLLMGIATILFGLSATYFVLNKAAKDSAR